MARDKGLEELLNDELADEHGITQKAMFGGWAWLFNGNLLCGARHDGMLVRLGKGQYGWALHVPSIVPMMSGSRHMDGWVRAAPEAYGDDALRRKLIDAALVFARSLRAK
ncbi:TfoX/Sxy family protein [Dyella caseinilytica]|uniref:Cold-shock protein n=1 Tax=Dyella caseinilytica TaxID=1849581 RepID=A0ABX7GW53_9GAMM|nr:TfoX/Sxy family protein [Dyella caseinilytica]QRN54632.1 cold-shock protein [Dyella caseinilytica]GFZ95675.1 cold-shock protein [Dyella caseinilytica]